MGGGIRMATREVAYESGHTDMVSQITTFFSTTWSDLLPSSTRMHEIGQLVHFE